MRSGQAGDARRGQRPTVTTHAFSAPEIALRARTAAPEGGGAANANGIDKSQLTHPEPRRFRDKEHVKFVAKQACLICGRRPADAHHLRFAQHRALGRKVSDEFTVPLCRGHHREAHRSGDEAAWWKNAAIDPTTTARALWLETHPLPTTPGTGTSIDRHPRLVSAPIREIPKGLTRVATAPSARFRRLSKIQSSNRVATK